jgi:hypothetical protein
MAAIVAFPSSRAPTGEIDRLIAAFNTWAFKRQQPTNPERIVELAHNAIATETALAFVLYWGKGPRREIAYPDLVCLDYLGDMAKRIRHVHAPGAAIELLLTDTHARLNGHAETEIDSYFRDISLAAVARGFTTRRLSSLCGVAAGVGSVTPVSPSELPPDLLDSAAKWYRGPGSAVDGACRYFAMNMIEKAAVERDYPDAIFVTFNNSRLRALFPDSMPIFYMYSLRKGMAVKPWFIADDEEASAGLATRASAEQTAHAQ